uniref:Bestrophin homolog n=1 Tax=Plectus sambesii TaxID=2011161 RepID=A0A914XJ38_9BILA
MQISAYVQGADERGRLMRRSMARYLNLITVLTFQATSTVIKRRFPTIDHLVDAGIMTEAERAELDVTVTPHGNWWIPASWFSQIAMVARKEGRIHDDLHLKSLIDEMMDFRGLCGTIWSYDWISVPLVYTQVVTIALYSFFVACLFGRQYLYEWPGEKVTKSHDIDFYVPVFTIFQFFFYVGWLKVAESMICPFGEDDDDFDLNWIIDRNIQVSYLAVDQMYRRFPKLTRDVFWDETEPNVPYTAAAANYKTLPFTGSTSAMNISHRDAEWDMPDLHMPVISEEMLNKKLAKEDGDIDEAKEEDVESNGSRRIDERRRRNRLTSLLFGNSRSSLAHSQSGSKMSVNSRRSHRRPSITSRSPTMLSRQWSGATIQKAGGVGSTITAPLSPTEDTLSNLMEMQDKLSMAGDAAAVNGGLVWTQTRDEDEKMEEKQGATSLSNSGGSSLPPAKVDVPPAVIELPEPSGDYDLLNNQSERSDSFGRHSSTLLGQIDDSQCLLGNSGESGDEQTHSRSHLTDGQLYKLDEIAEEKNHPDAGSMNLPHFG